MEIMLQTYTEILLNANEMEYSKKETIPMMFGLRRLSEKSCRRVCIFSPPKFSVKWIFFFFLHEMFVRFSKKIWWETCVFFKWKGKKSHWMNTHSSYICSLYFSCSILRLNYLLSALNFKMCIQDFCVNNFNIFANTFYNTLQCYYKRKHPWAKWH